MLYKVINSIVIYKQKKSVGKMLEVFLLTFSSEKPLNDDNVVEKVGRKEC